MTNIVKDSCNEGRLPEFSSHSPEVEGVDPCVTLSKSTSVHFPRKLSFQAMLRRIGPASGGSP